MTGPNGRFTKPYVGICAVCGKRMYATRAAARKAAKDLYPGHAMRAYQCDGHWHIGHLPDFVRKGKGRVE